MYANTAPMSKQCFKEQHWLTRTCSICSSNWNPCWNFWGWISDLLLKLRSWSCPWISAPWSWVGNPGLARNAPQFDLVENILLCSAHASASHWCCFLQPLAREFQALVNMVKKGSFAQMDFKSKARCYFLRNPPEGQKKTPLNVILSGHLSEQSLCFGPSASQEWQRIPLLALGTKMLQQHSPILRPQLRSWCHLWRRGVKVLLHPRVQWSWSSFLFLLNGCESMTRKKCIQ